jgi:hypothetical protein
MRRFFVSILYIGLLGIMVLSHDAHAAFTLTVNPTEGGRDIRFEPTTLDRRANTEEALVTITSDQGVRYRVIQDVLSPFVNERGQALSPQAILVNSPSSTLGTLRVEFPTNLRIGSREIYISDSSGTQDSFRLVFALDPQPGDPSGRFQSQIRYQLEAVDGSQTVVTIIKNVFVEITSEFKIEVRNVKGGRSLDLGKISQDRLVGEVTLQLDMNSNIGQRFQIFQQLETPLSNETGKMLGEQHLVFQASGPSKGSAPSGVQIVSRNRVLVYTSNASGSGETLTLSYNTQDVQTQRAGNYSSSLSFTAEASTPLVSNRPVRVPVQIVVESILDLEVEYGNTGQMDFGFFEKPGDTQKQHVSITVNNNTEEQYQVTQIISRPFSNEAGFSIPEDYFKATTEGKVSGTLSYLSLTPVKRGETVIYRSDIDGNPASFDIFYELTLPQDAAGGEYTSEVTYSITPV